MCYNFASSIHCKTSQEGKAVAQEQSNGKGSSKFRTAEQDAADRRAAKQRRRPKGSGRHGDGESLLVGIRNDREEAREEAHQQRERELQMALERAHNEALKHLRRYGSHTIPHKSGGAVVRPRWSDAVQGITEALLRAYFYGETDDIARREAELNEKVLTEVRQRFASACLFDREVKETPGQAQPWFADMLEVCKAFHAARREAKRVGSVA
jgi:hypothetical protein